MPLTMLWGNPWEKLKQTFIESRPVYNKYEYRNTLESIFIECEQVSYGETYWTQALLGKVVISFFTFCYRLLIYPT